MVCSGTKTAEFYETKFEGTPICLMDIPGFQDNQNLTDQDVLRMPFTILPSSRQVKGVVYLHEIDGGGLGPEAVRASLQRY